MSNKNKVLKPWMIYAYACAVLGFNVMMNMNTTYVNFYLTDIALIPVATVAVLLLIVRIADMFLVPIAGGVMEKSNMKWGKYRSWLLVGAPILGVFFTLIFTNFNVSLPIKIAIFMIVYLAAHFCVNLVYGALYALIPLMSKSNHERSLISAARVQFTAINQIFFGYIGMPLILFFTGSGATEPGARGFMMTTAVICIFMVVTFWIAFKATEKFDIPNVLTTKENKKKPTLSAKEMTSLTIKNPHLLAVILGDTLRGLTNFSIFGAIAYYFIYVIGDISKISMFLGTLGIINLITATLVPVACKVIDKRTLYMAGLLTIAVTSITAFFVATSALAFTIIVGIAFVGLSITVTTSPAMFADATDYSELKYGKEGKGFLMSLANLPPKISLIIAGVITGAILSAVGYVPGMAPTPELIIGIKAIVHIVPAVSCLIGIAIIMKFNKLTVSKVQEIQDDIVKISNGEIE